MRRTDYAVVAAVALVIFDGLMTLPFMHLEGNPIVSQLGAGRMMGVKLLFGLGFAWIWFNKVRNSNYQTVGSGMVWSLVLLYSVVVGSNIIVLAA